MKNFVQDGKVLEVTAPAAVTSGDFVLVGSIGGVAVVSAASGTKVPVLRGGVFTLPKETGTAWAQGDQLYWDATNKRFTKTATANTKWGVAAADAVAADATGQVSFTPIG